MMNTRNVASAQQHGALISPVSLFGYRFKSKVKAQWALLFSLMGESWFYEPERFVVGYLDYRPDFFLERCDSFADVLPAYNPHGVCRQARQDAQVLSAAVNKTVFVLVGDPLQVISHAGYECAYPPDVEHHFLFDNARDSERRNLRSAMSFVRNWHFDDEWPDLEDMLGTISSQDLWS